MPIELATSVRDCPPQVTLRRVGSLIQGLGVSRVTEITRLDRVGVPVVTSVRPGALPGTLCVTAGKGLTIEEARVGASMEAIEYAMAEPDRRDHGVVLGSARDVIDGGRRRHAILDFCPIVNRSVDLEAPLACMEAEELLTLQSVMVPAETVLHPYTGRAGTGLFGSTTNGLASGNTLAEATLHGVLEVVERDTRSFHRVRDSGSRIIDATLPDAAQAMIDQVRAAGLEICVRVLPGDLGVPVYQALIFDAAAERSLFLVGGFGCHTYPDIAALRAIAEAVQSRLSFIHGARDDLVEADEEVVRAPMPKRRAAAAGQFRLLADGIPIGFDESARDLAPRGASVGNLLTVLLDLLRSRGVRHVCRVRLTSDGDPIEVVKIVIPRLEYFDRFCHRVGPRLHAFIRNPE